MIPPVLASPFLWTHCLHSPLSESVFSRLSFSCLPPSPPLLSSLLIRSPFLSSLSSLLSPLLLPLPTWSSSSRRLHPRHPKQVKPTERYLGSYASDPPVPPSPPLLSLILLTHVTGKTTRQTSP